MLMINKNLTEKDLSYIGGIFDGEGCISITKVACSEVRRGFYFKLIVNIGNTNEWLLNWFKLNFGGNILLNKRNKGQPFWCWSLSAQQALSFLYIVKPYLRIKNYQAEVAILFQETKRRGACRNDSEIAVEEVQALLLKNLHKGILNIENKSNI